LFVLLGVCVCWSGWIELWCVEVVCFFVVVGLGLGDLLVVWVGVFWWVVGLFVGMFWWCWVRVGLL